MMHFVRNIARALPLFCLSMVMLAGDIVWAVEAGGEQGHPAQTVARSASLALNGLAESMDDRTQTLTTLLDLEAEQLRQRVKALRAAYTLEKDQLNKATAELSVLRATHKDLESEYTQAVADMQSVEDAVRTCASQTREVFAKSAMTSLIPSRLDLLENIVSSRAFPSLKDIGALGDLLLSEIHAGESVQIMEGGFLDPDGNLRNGRLMRAGSIFLGAVDEGGHAFLLLPGSEPPTAVATTPGTARDRIANWADGVGNALPLDSSHGAALSLLQSRRTVDDWIQGGGMLLWPILAVGLLAFLAVVYKSIRLLNVHLSPKSFPCTLREAWDTGGWASIETVLHSLPRVPAARVLLWVTPDADTNLCDKQLQEGFLFELRQLESLLGFIAIMAAVAPLLGLLGTVTGMIESFQAITIFGTSNPRIMSGGISEALITTQAGLGVAIPVMLLHHFLKQRVQALASDMEQQCAALLSAAHGERHG